MRDEEREHGGRSRVVRLSHEQHQGDHEQPRGERHGTEMLERGEQTPIGRGDRPRRRLSCTIGPISFQPIYDGSAASGFGLTILTRQSELVRDCMYLHLDVWICGRSAVS